MYRYLLLAFFLIPLLEVWIFVNVGRETGATAVIALIFITALIGVYFLRQQGLSTLRRAQETLARGGVPANELLEGAMLLIAGAFLMTPGFFTDFVGILLLWGAGRRRLANRFSSHLAARAQYQTSAEERYDFYYEQKSRADRAGTAGSDSIRTAGSGSVRQGAPVNKGNPDIIEGEFERE